ncbi:hypothetical protein KCP73_23905 [Salmonella enterica subsp. enterica]|nr:hypothetical protein KCP73_23905 [Salmonella enterica subsp. enterica]
MPHAVVRSGDLIVKGMEGAIAAKTVTHDFLERLMEGAKLLKCSEFGDAIIAKYVIIKENGDQPRFCH